MNSRERNRMADEYLYTWGAWKLQSHYRYPGAPNGDCYSTTPMMRGVIPEERMRSFNQHIAEEVDLIMCRINLDQPLTHAVACCHYIYDIRCECSDRQRLHRVYKQTGVDMSQRTYENHLAKVRAAMGQLI